MSLPTDNAKRKALPLWDYMFGYFPDSFLAEVEVAVAGNNQHNQGEALHWAREKSTDQLNTAFRHQFDYGKGVKRDIDGCWHLAKAIWRLRAQLQLDIEAERVNKEQLDTIARAEDDLERQILRNDLQRYVNRCY
jgi:hypothetical protein